MNRKVGILWVLLVTLGFWPGQADAATVSKKNTPPKTSAAVETVQRYVAAMAAGDKVAAGKLDFACAYRLAAATDNPPDSRQPPARPAASFPPDGDSLYSACWEPIAKAHTEVIQQTDQGVDTLWPGKGSLVVLGENLTRYPPSLFVMDTLGASPPAGGLAVDLLNSTPIHSASFRLTESGPVVTAPATLVRLSVGYKDPLSSPAAYAPGSYKWTNTTKRLQRRALKTITVKWIVLSGLKKLGFPADQAVLNLPVKDASDTTQAIPFTAEAGGYEPDSARWWMPDDAPGVLIAAVGRAAQFPEIRDRVGMLNRVLIIDPSQVEALTLLSRDLYRALLHVAAGTHAVAVSEPTLAMVFNELYWNTYAQTVRWDLVLGMEMGGLSQPTAADFLYRMILAMRQLEKVRPQDLENRLHLGNAYRWNMDQLAAIAMHETLLREVPTQRAAVRARVLNELAWSRIAKVAWNRTFEDPGILQAYKEAEEAFQLTDTPLDKFVATYTMAYSQLFMPKRDNKLIFERLTEAKALYLALPGATPVSWKYLLNHESLKIVLDADPIFKPLLEGV